MTKLGIHRLHVRLCKLKNKNVSFCLLFFVICTDYRYVIKHCTVISIIDLNVKQVV